MRARLTSINWRLMVWFIRMPSPRLRFVRLPGRVLSMDCLRHHRVLNKCGQLFNTSVHEGISSILRKDGFYASNNVKTDYNNGNWKEIIAASWNENSDTAHWKIEVAISPSFRYST